MNSSDDDVYINEQKYKDELKPRISEWQKLKFWEIEKYSICKIQLSL